MRNPPRYVLVCAEPDPRFPASDPRHMRLSSYDYEDGNNSLRFAAALIQAGTVMQLAVIGPGDRTVFEYARPGL